MKRRPIGQFRFRHPIVMSAGQAYVKILSNAGSSTTAADPCKVGRSTNADPACWNDPQQL
jgi:hypothetical protein